MNEVLVKYFENLYKNEKMGHAFLICNTTYEDIKEEISFILNKYFFEKNISIIDTADVYFVKPKNNKILKDEILSLQETFKTTSQSNYNRVYIIDGVEKMNDYAANSLLKFLEEPESGIFAFLISSNLNKVIPTIKSRCQILMINSFLSIDLNKFDGEVIEKAIKFVECFLKHGTKTISYMLEFMNKKEERDFIRDFLLVIKYFYKECLDNKLSIDTNQFDKYKEIKDMVIKKNSVKEIINILMVLNKSENMLEYNVNLNLYLDNLIIDMEEAKNG